MRSSLIILLKANCFTIKNLQKIPQEINNMIFLDRILELLVFFLPNSAGSSFYLCWILALFEVFLILKSCFSDIFFLIRDRMICSSF